MPHTETITAQVWHQYLILGTLYTKLVCKYTPI